MFVQVSHRYFCGRLKHLAFKIFGAFTQSATACGRISLKQFAPFSKFQCHSLHISTLLHGLGM